MLLSLLSLLLDIKFFIIGAADTSMFLSPQSHSSRIFAKTRNLLEIKRADKIINYGGVPTTYARTHTHVPRKSKKKIILFICVFEYLVFFHALIYEPSPTKTWEMAFPRP